MIVDFTIRNFRSVKDEMLLSMNVTSSSNHLTENISTASNNQLKILRSVGIYGANASGKSNILKAFHALIVLTVESGKLNDGEVLKPYEPYLLSHDTIDQPISFEIEFINLDGLVYLYKITFSKYEILEESLDFYPTRSKANLFKRSMNDTWETISFGAHYKGGVRRIPFFKNNSYLSKAGQNAGSPEIIRSVYNYISECLNYLTPSRGIQIKDLHEKEKLVQNTAKFLSFIDSGISDISVQLNEKVPELDNIPDGLPAGFKEMIIEESKRKFLFGHLTEAGEKEYFEKSKESLGTQKLFSLVPLLITTFRRGEVLIADELESSLHPHIVELIIKLFNDPQINTKNAQLIFSTHNIQLMNPQSLRRDQIWFSEKRNGSTSLFSLENFDKKIVKPNSPFDAWYSEGRFGGIPSVNYYEIAKLLAPDSPEL